MANTWFRFKQFVVHHHHCAMKVTTDACLFGAWCAHQLSGQPPTRQAALDLGTGSGLLALMLAQKTGYAIDAVELDPAAAAQATTNIAASPWAERIRVLEGDARNISGQQYHLIVSNPPFYDNDLKGPHAAANLAHHATRLSLPELAALLARQLTDDGRFFLLFPAKREAALDNALRVEGLWCWEKVFVSATEGSHPFRILVAGGKTRPAVVSSQPLAIKDSGSRYTPSFAALLQDYYLAL